MQQTVLKLLSRLKVGLWDALNTVLDMVQGASGSSYGKQRSSALVCNGLKVILACIGQVIRQSGVLSLLSTGRLGAAVEDQQQQQVKSTAIMADISHNEPKCATSNGWACAAPQLQAGQVPDFSPQPDSKSKMMAAAPIAATPPAASSVPTSRPWGAAEEAAAETATLRCAAAAASAALLEPDSCQLPSETGLHERGGGEGGKTGHKSELLYAGGGLAVPAVAPGLAQLTGGRAAGSKAALAGQPELLLPPGRLVWLFQGAQSQEVHGTSAAGSGKVSVAAPMHAVDQRRDAAADSATTTLHEQVEGAAQSHGSNAMVAAIAERHSFSRVLLSPTMMKDHTVDAYLRALSAL